MYKGNFLWFLVLTFWPKFLAKNVSISYPLEYGDCTTERTFFCGIDNISTVSKEEDRKLGNNMKLFKNSPLTEFSKQIKSFAWLLWKFDSGLLFSTTENKIIFKKYSTYLSSEFVEIALRTVTSSLITFVIVTTSICCSFQREGREAMLASIGSYILLVLLGRGGVWTDTQYWQK